MKIILKATIIIIVLIIGSFAVFTGTILAWSQPDLSQEKYESIIVLTGAKGRIETGFELLLQNHAPQLYISGVREKITLSNLIDNNRENLSDEQVQALESHCCITLDFTADTTFTNASETASWVQENEIKNFILVTSALHMPRAYLLFNNEVGDHVKIIPYPYFDDGRLNMIQNKHFWVSAVTEYFKFIASFLHLAKI